MSIVLQAIKKRQDQRGIPCADFYRGRFDLQLLVRVLKEELKSIAIAGYRLRADVYMLEQMFGLWVTGDMSNAPVASNPIKPRSNRWSMLGVSKRPFSPSSRPSFLQSRHGLQWLARRCSGFETPVIRHRLSSTDTRCRNKPWPRRA